MNCILFETASGYSLFEVIGGDEIGRRNLEVQQQYQSFELFSKIVKIVSFYPFQSLQNALENMNDISEGILNDTLKNFLENKLPSDATLGIVDDKIGFSIRESLGIKVKRTSTIQELVRFIRFHFPNFIKRLLGEELQVDDLTAQQGLAHAYSRSKVKFNVNKDDNMVIHGNALLIQLDKDVNTFSMRLREWYSRHFPELGKIINDNTIFARCAQLIGSRSNIVNNPNLINSLTEILGSNEKALDIISAAKSSMGMDISEIDLICIENFANRVISLSNHRELIQKYMIKTMNKVAPNLSALIGESLGASLITKAGSLTNLSKCSASTIQVLGAEKALFRAFKTKGNTPKYGLIYNSGFIGKAKSKDKGRISRYLSNKCSLASRLDAFSEYPTSLYGSTMRQQIEDRLKFYETGKVPAKNIDVMKAVHDEVINTNNELEEDDDDAELEHKPKNRKLEDEEMKSSENDEDELKSKNNDNNMRSKEDSDTKSRTKSKEDNLKHKKDKSKSNEKKTKTGDEEKIKEISSIEKHKKKEKKSKRNSISKEKKD